MKHLKYLSIIAAVLAIFSSTHALAAGSTMQCAQNNLSIVTSGGTSYTSGATGLVTTVSAGKDVTSLLAQGCSLTGLQGVQAGVSGTAGTLTVYPATALYGNLAITDTGNVGAYNTIINNAAVGQADTLTIPDPGNATASFVLTKGTQTLAGNTTLTGTLTATASTTDINPAYSTAVLGNPVSKTTYGTLSVAAVNAGTGTILAGTGSRKIVVTHFDIIAAGSAATCTGVLLEDDNGTPVVVATLAAATLTNGSHNVPLAATLGVGFGAGSGLTAGAGLQLKVNGSSCTTTTAFNYAVTYTVQ